MHMKKSLKVLSLAVLAVGGLGVAPAMAQNPNFTPGDLIMGFRATGGIGSTSTILADLGDTATVYRDATGSITNILNLGTVLSNTFGTGAGNAIEWYERTDLLFGLAGTWSNSNPPSSLQNGDPESTLYISKSRTAVGANEFLKNSTINAPSLGNTSAAANAMISMQQVLETQYSNGTEVIPTSLANTWDEYNPMTGATQNTAWGGAFTGGIQQAFSVGNRGTYSVGIAEGALDLYRVSLAENGDVPGGYVSSTANRAGEFQGTIVIAQSGAVSFNAASVPEPTSAMLLGITGLVGVIARRRRSIA